MIGLGISAYPHKMEITVPLLSYSESALKVLNSKKQIFVDCSFCTCFTHYWRRFAGGETEAQTNSSFQCHRVLRIINPWNLYGLVDQWHPSKPHKEYHLLSLAVGTGTIHVTSTRLSRDSPVFLVTESRFSIPALSFTTHNLGCRIKNFLESQFSYW